MVFFLTWLEKIFILEKFFGTSETDFKSDLKVINNYFQIVTESTKKNALQYVLEYLDGCPKR